MHDNYLTDRRIRSVCCTLYSKWCKCDVDWAVLNVRVADCVKNMHAFIYLPFVLFVNERFKNDPPKMEWISQWKLTYIFFLNACMYCIIAELIFSLFNAKLTHCFLALDIYCFCLHMIFYKTWPWRRWFLRPLTAMTLTSK